MGKITKNTLFYGDNLDILREYIEDESIDLIYLDPPFNSNRSYNILFKDESGFDSEAQITAFDDSWHWGDSAEETFYELVQKSSPKIASMIGSFRQFIGTNQMMAYLVMMTTRLIELHRILKPTGSLYLHCDPTASHYLKIILDTIFNQENFINEIAWCYASGGVSKRYFGRKHEVIFFYAKSKDYKFNTQFRPYSEGTLERGLTDYKKRLNEKYELHDEGAIMNDWWEDITPLLSPTQYERLGYPTQKPIDLLERIIKASSDEGDLILDPFSGCGTAIAAAQKLNRKWIGIDITYLAIALHKNRLKDMYGLEPKIDYDIVGDPQSIHDARILAEDNRYQFQWWALSLIEARPLGEKKKGSDRGIDGIITFTDEATANIKQILIQVKSGHVQSGLVRDFRGTIEREINAVMGVFITLENPSRDMETEALEAGYYISPFTGQKYRKIQIITIEELLTGKNPDLPKTATFQTFKKAEKVKKDSEDVQGTLDL